VSLDKPKLADVGSLIRDRATLREHTYRVCLAGELVGEYEELERQLRDVRADDESFVSPAGAIRARMDELRGEMAEETAEFRLRALPRKKFRELIAAHPPRKDDDGNVIQRDYLGVNYETFFDALIRKSIVEPELDADTLTLLLDERLTDRQYEDFTDVVWNLNRASVNVPFLQAASPSQPSSGNE
jgi:hypothetical protein